MPMIFIRPTGNDVIAPTQQGRGSIFALDRQNKEIDRILEDESNFLSLMMFQLILAIALADCLYDKEDAGL